MYNGFMYVRAMIRFANRQRLPTDSVCDFFTYIGVPFEIKPKYVFLKNNSAPLDCTYLFTQAVEGIFDDVPAAFKRSCCRNGFVVVN